MKRNDSGAPPSTGFAVFKPELLVTDLEASLVFLVDVLGFQIAYQRTSKIFVQDPDGYLLMLEQSLDMRELTEASS